MNYREISSPEMFPSGDCRPIAVIKGSPDEISAFYRVTFLESLDDLGEVQFTYLEIQGIGQVLLLRRLGSSDPGTEVWIDSALVSSSVSVVEALSVLMKSLELTKEDMTWTLLNDK